tara:strand:- start:19 stop:180 length:162 start_codon:yes stop_codon:yes gene_type:complete
MLRGENPAAPAARTIGTVHPYWIQRREQREKASRKRQATSRKPQAKKTLTLFK